MNAEDDWFKLPPNEAEYEIGDYQFITEDTKLYFYDEPYEDVSHIYRNNKANQSPICIFECAEHMVAMRGLGFTAIYKAVPNKQDIELYIGLQHDSIDEEWQSDGEL